MAAPARPLTRIAYLGPQGTFSEEALLSEPDLARCELCSPPRRSARRSAAAASGEVDAAFVPFENSIEGSVNLTLDQLVFDVELRIQREVVLQVHMDLLARPGTELAQVRRVFSFPAATAQCRKFLAQTFPGAEIVATNSTADAARVLAESPSATPSRSRRLLPPSSTGSTCSTTRSRTTPATRPASCSSARDVRRRRLPGMTAPRSSASNTRIVRGVWRRC